MIKKISLPVGDTLPRVEGQNVTHDTYKKFFPSELPQFLEWLNLAISEKFALRKRSFRFLLVKKKYLWCVSLSWQVVSHCFNIVTFNSRTSFSYYNHAAKYGVCGVDHFTFMKKKSQLMIWLLQLKMPSQALNWTWVQHWGLVERLPASTPRGTDEERFPTSIGSWTPSSAGWMQP